jgi:hypothetical protein
MTSLLLPLLLLPAAATSSREALSWQMPLSWADSLSSRLDRADTKAAA